jgi:hypothetical protein
LTARLGYGWEARQRRHSVKPRYEITGVPETLMAEFSRRSEHIAEHAAKLREDFVAAHGRAASRVEDMRLHQVATIATRPDKAKQSLATLTAQWRDRASRHVPLEDQLAFVASLENRNNLPLLRSGDLGDAILSDASETVVTTVAERHSTYGRHNLLAEAHRILHGVRFASPDDRVAVAERVTEFAVEKSLRLTPPELCHVPEHFRRADGSSRLRPRNHVVYTTIAIVTAEARLLDAARQVSGPRVSEAALSAAAGDAPGRAHDLSADQRLAVEKIVTSGRVVDVLVGPAGTGKTTAMAGLRAVWEQAHGPGSVIGLAPSAAAAEALSAELGIETENTSKWLSDSRRVSELTAVRRRLEMNLARHPHPGSAGAARLRAKLRSVEQAIGRSQLRAGQLVIVDEASLASTFALDEIVSAARQAGAKILLAGDVAQLGSIDAGGAFSLLVKDRADLVPQLSEVRRFIANWERQASLGLRVGDARALDAYETHGRITGGTRTEMIAAVYDAWRADVEAGKSSLMIGADAATVAELNRLARAARVGARMVSEEGLRIADGEEAGVGDEVFTRQNDRRLAAGSGFVKNGDRWVVTATDSDGTMAVRPVSGGADVTLPASYVREHVELAYATTAFRSQGRTVDAAHAMVSPTTAREVVYVAATRGRESNRLYVDVAYDVDPTTAHHDAVMPDTACDVLARVLANEGSELSAHEFLARAQGESEDLATLAAEYEAIARVGDQERWDAVLERCGLGPRRAEKVRRSEAYGPLVAALRRAEASGLDVESGLCRLVTGRGVGGVDDLAAVLHHRVTMWTAASRSMTVVGADLVAGLVQRAAGVADPDLARALFERERAMERLATPDGGPDELPTGPTVNERRAAAHAAASHCGDGQDRRSVGADGVDMRRVRKRRRATVAAEQASRLTERSTITSVVVEARHSEPPLLEP